MSSAVTASMIESDSCFISIALRRLLRYPVVTTSSITLSSLWATATLGSIMAPGKAAATASDSAVRRADSKESSERVIALARVLLTILVPPAKVWVYGLLAHLMNGSVTGQRLEYVFIN